MGQSPMRERQCRFLSSITISKPFWTLRGAEGDDDDKDKNGTESGSSEGGEGTEGTEGGDGTEGSSAPHGTTVSLQEYEALKSRMQAADKNRAAAEQKVKEFEDKDRSELERAQRDLKESKEISEKLEKQLAKSTIHNKFLASNKHTWHDPETALALLDMNEVTIEDDGSVKGLEDAIEKLAKAKPFLLKEEDDKGKDGKGKDKKDKEGGRPSGSQPPANGSNSRETDRDKLIKKYPQLAR